MSDPDQRDFVLCPSNEYMRIGPVVSLIFNSISLISTILVLISLTVKKKEQNLNSNKKVFSSLVQTSIYCLIITDLLCELFYTPNLIISVASFSFEHVSKTMLSIIWIVSQLTESFVIGSGIWSFLISLSILICLRQTQTKNENVNYHAKELILRCLYVLLGWGIPVIHALIWINVNLRFQFEKKNC
jgi:hypothetical protein